jgi:hypothetical protein
MTKHPEEYLGDGLYVSFDGYQFALRAPRDGGDHVVYLELSVVKAFQRYAERTVKQVQTREVE